MLATTSWPPAYHRQIKTLPEKSLPRPYTSPPERQGRLCAERPAGKAAGGVARYRPGQERRRQRWEKAKPGSHHGHSQQISSTRTIGDLTENACACWESRPGRAEETSIFPLSKPILPMDRQTTLTGNDAWLPGAGATAGQTHGAAQSAEPSLPPQPVFSRQAGQQRIPVSESIPEDQANRTAPLAVEAQRQGKIPFPICPHRSVSGLACPGLAPVREQMPTRADRFLTCNPLAGQLYW